MFLARWAIRIVFGLIAIVILYLGVTFAQVWWASRGNDTSPASAIVVMGAAQWNGVPSPVLKGRLDHAVDLYRRGVAPVIIVTGGKQSGDSVTQALSGFSYLRDQGVPEAAIRIEVDGTNSFEELSASAAILRKAGIGDSVVIVSDPYHALRVEEIAREVGLKPHVSPTDSSLSLRPMLRETVAVAIGRLIGFRRLASLR
jgi:uncharacterized SAM-binding protein YcdF (DUF218 family)